MMITHLLEDLLWQCMGMEDPILAMLDWICSQLMEIEVSAQIGAQKNTQIQLSKIGL